MIEVKYISEEEDDFRKKLNRLVKDGWIPKYESFQVRGGGMVSREACLLLERRISKLPELDRTTL